MSIFRSPIPAFFVVAALVLTACARPERTRAERSNPSTGQTPPAKAPPEGDDPLAPSGIAVKTRVGVQGSPTPAQVRALGAESVRMMLKSNQLKGGLQRSEASVQRLQGLKAAGAEVIACVRWPRDSASDRQQMREEGDRQATHFDAIPTGRERESALRLLEQFLVLTKGSLDWYQLGNEVLSGPGRYSEEDWRSGAALEWLTALADRAHEVIQREHLSVRIVSPALYGVSPDLAGETGAVIDSLIKFAGKHCDALDIHLHVKDYDDLVNSVESLKTRMKKLNVDIPLVALEWSLSGATRDWFARDSSRRDYVQKAYKSPDTMDSWKRFVESGPYRATFMRKSYQYLNEQGFLMVCWAPMGQYGSPVYDVSALLASSTVRGKQAPNEPFYSDFRRLTTEVHSKRSR